MIRLHPKRAATSERHDHLLFAHRPKQAKMRQRLLANDGIDGQGHGLHWQNERPGLIGYDDSRRGPCFRPHGRHPPARELWSANPRDWELDDRGGTRRRTARYPPAPAPASPDAFHLAAQRSLRFFVQALCLHEVPTSNTTKRPSSAAFGCAPVSGRQGRSVGRAGKQGTARHGTASCTDGQPNGRTEKAGGWPRTGPRLGGEGRTIGRGGSRRARKTEEQQGAPKAWRRGRVERLGRDLWLRPGARQGNGARAPGDTGVVRPSARVALNGRDPGRLPVTARATSSPGYPAARAR